MTTTDDLLQAKQALSARFLSSAMQRGVVGMRASLRVNAALAAGPTVHAVGIGSKLVDGAPTSTKAVRLYIVQKMSRSMLPPRALLPESVDGVPVDVIESPPAFAFARRPRKKAAPAAAATPPPTCTARRQERQRPVVAGISTAHVDVTAGTLGYFCRSKQPGDAASEVYVLSNNHVLADVNKAHVGDDLVQPGPLDGGVGGDHFADLHRFVHIRLEAEGSNRVDAAIGRLRSGIEFRPEVCSIGRVDGTARAVEQMQVRKHGRTTGYTEGVVSDESYDALVGMDHNDPKVVARFINQMRIVGIPPFHAFGLGGDSGSLVLQKSTRKAVGLYFAGPDDGSYGVANHIEDVLSELEIELL